MYLNSKEQDRRIIFEFLNEEFQEQENSNEKKPTQTNTSYLPGSLIYYFEVSCS